MADFALLQRYTREIEDLTRGRFRFTAGLDAIEVVMLIGELQLALKHPGNKGATAEFARELIKRLTAQVPAGCAAIHEVIRKGWEETP
jgi:hypothetical protein